MSCVLQCQDSNLEVGLGLIWQVITVEPSQAILDDESWKQLTSCLNSGILNGPKIQQNQLNSE